MFNNIFWENKSLRVKSKRADEGRNFFLKQGRLEGKSFKNTLFYFRNIALFNLKNNKVANIFVYIIYTELQKMAENKEKLFYVD